WRRLLRGMWCYHLGKTRPEEGKALTGRGVRAELGEEFDIATHFPPRYSPWDPRLCLVPDSDLFKAMKSGRASIVTDHIATFTENGVELQSGKEIEADIIITATGLVLEVLGGMEVTVDGARIDFSTTLNYRGAMYSG